MIQELINQEKASRAYQAQISPRARTLLEFEAEVSGKRFDDRRPWTDTDVPIYERRPCIVYHAVESSIRSKVDLMLGEGRFPTVTARPDEDEDEGKEDELDEEASEYTDKAISGIIKEARLRALFRQGYARAQGCGTMVALLGMRQRRLFAELLPAQWCTATRNALGELVSVEVCYPYVKQQKNGGKWEAVCYLYRRVIDRESDTVFAPAEAREDGIPPRWKVQSTAPHALGFCPVIWYKYNAPIASVDTEDGHPVHETILGELEAISYALSQRHHGALHALPQIVEIGVEPGYNPTAEGEQEQVVLTTMTGGAPSPGNPVRGAFKTSSRPKRGARKKGPNNVWQYSSHETRVESIDTPGDALQAIDSHIKDLRSKLCEVLAWVPLDPESIKFAATVSGKALEVLRERELNRVSQDREEFGECVILATVCMLLRIAMRFAGQLKTPGLADAVPHLKKLVGDGTEWQDPALTLKWPAFFLQSADDNQKTVDLAITAYDGGVITRRTQVETVRRIFGIDNVPEYLEKLEEEAEKKRENAVKSNALMLDDALSGSHPNDDLDDDDNGGNGAAKGRNPKPSSPSRSSKSGRVPGNKQPPAKGGF